MQNTNQLFEERTRSAEDFQRLSSDLERQRQKFTNVKSLYDFEVENFAQFRQDAQAKLANFEAEREALLVTNERMAARIAEVEKCDTDSAAIEIKRAAETIRQLTQTVNFLKLRLQENRQMKVEDQDRLKATIAVISDG